MPYAQSPSKASYIDNETSNWVALLALFGTAGYKGRISSSAQAELKKHVVPGAILLGARVLLPHSKESAHEDARIWDIKLQNIDKTIISW
ncbi:hypothetical protein AGABI2DRAFT_122428 [Agaricus bisporus var. bisporus H97]|uniref:hypothetical protein n=1 Tax=Agaricus bisporus var. bisporus (strain H97 / ATCC MYA-4626 / FGSC 10389) TaxID=936046 RepID=UPI00029F5BF4|nr:hypothetical protein AGABI2DRAFT_122428 [Agaricus bisporus var. bisporus H97]EKV42845.1 hypothetical protein AGABI2DRAFT_122428 [Agaricus bisporus var. bisporus H97]